MRSTFVHFGSRAAAAGVLLLSLAAVNWACGGGVAGPGAVTGGRQGGQDAAVSPGSGGATGAGAGGIPAMGSSSGGIIPPMGAGSGGIPAVGSGGATGSGGRSGSGGATGTGSGGTTGSGGAPGGGGSSGCVGSLMRCNGVCVDTTGSQSNCGGCGTTCRSDQTCWQSACRCATGQADCAGVCKDVMSSTVNCGTCGNACATGATCVAGQCQCPTDQVACSGACRAVFTDPQHCGACGRACGGATRCLFGACLDPSSLACSPTAEANRSPTRDAFITLGKYWVNNNWWGASSGSGSQSIWSTCQQGDLVAWGTSWNWTGTANGVKSFASAVLGWQWGWRLNSTGLPLQISSGTNLSCGWDFSITNSGGAANVAYDVFLHTQSNPGTNNDPTDEIMVWLYTVGGAGPVGTRQATVTIGSTTWDLYRGSTRWNVFSFVRQTNATTAVLNIMDFMRDLVARGWVQGSKYVSTVQAGTEVFSGTGQLNTRGYYCRLQ